MTTIHDKATRAASAWYHQPVVWLGIVVFLASLAGCAWIIMVSVRHADTPLATSRAVFGVPVSAHSAPHSPARVPPGPTP